MKILKGLLSLLLCLCLITPMGSAIVALNDGGIANMGSQANSGSPTSVPSETPAPSDTDTPAEAPDYAALYNDLMAAATFAEAHALLEGLTDEQLSAFIDSLTEEQYAALEEHIQSLIAEEPHEVPETVVFTDAGPFFPPVNVGDAWQLLTESGLKAGSDDGNGLETSKTVTINTNGSYTITIEAYATGTVATITRTIPVDIVLVLDQSGSMSYDFNGNSTSNNLNRRQYAMKQAVNSFIDAVAAKYDTADSDHRMAIVTFGSDASTLQGWTYVDAAGKNSLQGKISGLPDEPSGATNIAAGMYVVVETLFGSGYNYTGSNTERQKVVIVFTDGVPTTHTDFDTDVANNAITSSKKLKDAGATVYTVGIFNGADPKQLHGEKFDRWIVPDDPCNGNIGEYWGYTNMNDWFAGGEEVIRGLDIAATNRFLNFLSSNFSDATEIGIEPYSSGLAGGVAWRITKNFDRTDSLYYLTAGDSNSLNKIFQTISDQIQHPDIELGSETVLKDIIAPSFNVPQNTSSEITVQTAERTPSGEWAEPETVSAPDVTVTIDNDNHSISVTGFDYTANFVSEVPHPNGSYGKKLIITFTVTMREGFLGGNNVPTNGDSSGIYDGNKLVEFFERPEVNVLIGDVSVTASDKNVYLLGGLTAAQLKEDATVTVGGVSLDLAAADNNYGLDPWQTEYVNISVVIKDASGNAVTDGIDELSDDTTYFITVTVTPKYDGNGASGKANSMDGKSGISSNDDGKINVFKPVLTFADSEVWYGGQYTDYTANYKPVAWKHDTDEANTATMGNAPELTLNYATPENAIKKGYIVVPDDIPVNVSVKIGETAIDRHVSFVHADCSHENCGFDAATCEFILHVNTCSLTVEKAIAAGKLQDSDQSFIFKVRYPGIATDDGEVLLSADYNVLIVGAGSRTIVGLPVGSYTVRENTDWSWRYELVEGQNGVLATLSAENSTATVTMTNRLDNEFWLSDEAVATNVFNSNDSPEYSPMPAIIPGKEDLTDEAD